MRTRDTEEGSEQRSGSRGEVDRRSAIQLTMQCPSGTNQAIRRVVNGNGVFEKTPKRLWFVPMMYFVGIFESPLSARLSI